MSRRKKKQRKRSSAKSTERHMEPRSAASRTRCLTEEPDGRQRLRLTAELLEDAHPGSGAGGGGIDALVARDRKGHPVIWASHLEGVLRDAARKLKGDQAAGDFFGRAGGQRQRAVFTSLYSSTQPASRIWRSAARGAFDNRAPRDDTLRVVEHVPKGTKFEGQVELPRADVPFLKRLLQEVDALGSGRSTGAGRVKFDLTPVAPLSGRSVGGAKERLVLVLRNLDPLCITATATPDNLIPSLGFVPGRALLGALAAWLIGAGHRDTATLLVEGSIVLSDALPLPRPPDDLSAVEVLPAPLSLLHEKPPGASGPIPWWACSPVGTRRFDGYAGGPGNSSGKRPEPNLFVCREGVGDDWIAYRPKLRVRLRNGRPDPNQADPSLFAIEQIVEDTCFLCDLRGERDAMEQLADSLKPVLEGDRWLRVGRGGAPVEVNRLAWIKLPSGAKATIGYLILTSDLLVRDEKLRWYTSLDEETFRMLPDWPDDVKVSPVVQEAAPVHGFNGTARLWRMPAFAIRRGSVFRVEGSGISRLAEMIAAGQWLGERIHEGFGRFRLDETLPGVTSNGTLNANLDGLIEAQGDDPDEEIARTIHEWFEEHNDLAEHGNASNRRPSLSQWFDLVSELESGVADALNSRLNPSTAGARSWRNADAKAILEKLNDQNPEECARHARMFVRRLRAEPRGRRT